MKNRIYVFLIITLIALSFNLHSQENETRISGEVVGRNSKEILLVPITEDFNNITFLQIGIAIPIRDKKFEYVLKTPFVEEYQLIFKEEAESGGYLIREFFNDSSSIKVIIYPDSIHANNSFEGGKLNRIKNKRRVELYKTLDPICLIRDSLNSTNKLYTIEFSDLNNEIRNTKDREAKKQLFVKRDSLRKRKLMYTPMGQKVLNDINNIGNNEKLWRESYIKDNTDVLAYSLLYNQIKSIEVFDALLFGYYNRFSEKFPDHPYTNIIRERFETLKSIKIGGKYINFTAPTIDGEIVKLSEIVEGKVALINLWSSWCGSCRVAGKSMIPIYEKFKNKGFTVIGVAGEYRNTNAFKIAIEKDKYPWLNLIELNNQNRIWFKYGISGSGGSTFLIDSKGKILAINPKVEKIDEILNDLLD